MTALPTTPTAPTLGLHHTIPGVGFTFAVEGGANATLCEIKPASVTSPSIHPSLMQVTSVALTSANLKAMYATPVQLLAAPGSGSSYIIHKVLFRMTCTSTAYTSGGNVYLQYTTNTTAVTTAADLPTSIVTGSAGTTDSMVNGIDVNSLSQNDTISITNATGAFATGTGTAVVYIWYSVT